MSSYADRFDKWEQAKWCLFLRGTKGWIKVGVEFDTQTNAHIAGSEHKQNDPSVESYHVQFCKPSEARTLARQWNERSK